MHGRTDHSFFGGAVMKRNLTCIVCPRGCSLTAELKGEKVSVSGQGCPRGAEYAASECLHPMRTVTLALRVANRENEMVSVKTEKPIPKEKMMEAVQMLRGLTVNAPLEVGDTICESVFESRIMVTKGVL